MSYRKFYFLNLQGDEYHFTSKSQFIESPDGLGFSRENSYIDFEDEAILTAQKTNYQMIEFEILFETYSLYRNFVNFVANEDFLILAYKTDETFFINVCVEEITKSEINDRKRLNCTVRLRQISHYYQEYIEVVQEREKNKNKKFPYTYLYRYQTNKQFFNITNNGHFDLSFTLEIIAPFNNVFYNLETEDNETLYQGRIITSKSTGKLIISSFSNDFGIYYITNTGEKLNYYDYQDYAKDNLFYIPKGVYRLALDDEQNNRLDAKIFFRKQYISV